MSEPAPAILNEKSHFGWVVVVALITCAVVFGGAYTRVLGLERDLERQQARIDGMERQSNLDRSQLNATSTSVGEMKGLMLEMRSDIRELLRARPVSARITP